MQAHSHAHTVIVFTITGWMIYFLFLCFGFPYFLAPSLPPCASLSPSSLLSDSQVVSSCQKHTHTLPPTHG